MPFKRVQTNERCDDDDEVELVPIVRPVDGKAKSCDLDHGFQGKHGDEEEVKSCAALAVREVTQNTDTF